MAKKYLKHIVTRDNQLVDQVMIDYVVDHNRQENILCFADHVSWHMYDMIQSGFYCNWPNTNNNRYFIKANSLILSKGSEVYHKSNRNLINNYFGYIILNGNDNTHVSFEVDGSSENILAETGLLLISPETDEQHSIKWDLDYDLVMVKFNITPVQNIVHPNNWIPF
jgi:hypothetical protein